MSDLDKDMEKEKKEKEEEKKKIIYGKILLEELNKKFIERNF